MKRFLCLGLFLVTLADASEPAGRVILLYGQATNLTAETAANMRLELTFDGENVTGVVATEAPLAGSGRVSGKHRGGWCELSGTLNEGFELQFRGVLNARDFRGTYIVAQRGNPVQYGKFRLVVQPPRAPRPGNSRRRGGFLGHRAHLR